MIDHAHGIFAMGIFMPAQNKKRHQAGIYSLVPELLCAWPGKQTCGFDDFGNLLFPFNRYDVNAADSLDFLQPFMSRAGISIRKEICPNSFLLPQSGLYLQDVKKTGGNFGGCRREGG